MDMQKKMKRWLWPLLLCLSLLLPWGCESDEEKVEICTIGLKCPVSPLSGKAGDIVGKWKLVLATETQVSTPQLMDYSCDNIIYEFRKDGKLVITSDVEGQLEGEYAYTYTDYWPDMDFEYNAQIDGTKCVFLIKKQQLEIYMNPEVPSASEFPKHARTLIRVK